jgi:hypothetical protein
MEKALDPAPWQLEFALGLLTHTNRYRQAHDTFSP